MKQGKARGWRGDRRWETGRKGREVFSEKVTFEQRHEGVNHVDIWGRAV